MKQRGCIKPANHDGECYVGTVVIRCGDIQQQDEIDTLRVRPVCEAGAGMSTCKYCKRPEAGSDDLPGNPDGDPDAYCWAMLHFETCDAIYSIATDYDRLRAENETMRAVIVGYADAFDAAQRIVGIQTAAAYEEKTLRRSDALVEVLRLGRRLREAGRGGAR